MWPLHYSVEPPHPSLRNLAVEILPVNSLLCSVERSHHTAVLYLRHFFCDSNSIVILIPFFSSSFS